jgi:hypothetical protein
MQVEAHAMGFSQQTGFTVYGNCQAAALMRLLLQVPEFKVRHMARPLPPCFTVSRSDIDQWAQQTAPSIGLFIHQKLRKGWRKDEAFDTDWLAQRAPAGIPVLTWSDMYYKAYEPHVAYPKTFPRCPPSDYLNLLHVLAFVHKRPWQDLIPLYRDPDTMPEAPLVAMHRASCDDLTEREAGCTMAIAPFIARNWRRQRLFLTFNHPARPVMRHAANQVLAHLEITGEVPEEGRHDFAEHACQPLLASVAHLLDEPSTKPFEQSFYLRGKTVAMQDYFEAWQTALERIGIPALMRELRVQAEDPVFVRPVLEAGARVLGVESQSLLS